jgi:DNA helicase HerA-like ATPase
MSIDALSGFDAWERRSRGYQVWPYPVELEPAYGPIVSASPPVQQLDDGRRPGILGMLFGASAPAARPLPTPPSLPVPSPLLHEPELAELQLVLPNSFAVRHGLASELFGALHNLAHPLAFELIGLPEGIVLQFCCAEEDRPTLLECVRAFFPEVRIKEHQRFLDGQWFAEPRYVSMIDFGLSNYFFHTLRSSGGFETDPLIGVVGALNELRDGELALLQILFHPSVESWGGDLWDFASEVEGAGEILPLVRQKFAERPHAAVIRVAALSDLPDAAFARARSIGSAVLSATQTPGNGLIPLDNEGYPSELHEADFLRRQTHRSGMILSAAELLTLVHLPSASVRSDRLLRQDERTHAAPLCAQSGEMLLGTNEHDGEEVEVRLSTDQRLKHTYLVGASGTGKSTLLLNMILQDIERGAGVAVLDPHGDLVEDVLARMPVERASDVVLFDPSDTEWPLGFNVLSAQSDLDKTLLSSDLVAVFRGFSTSWGDQMNAVLGNAILAFLEHPKGGTLLDLRRFLVDERFRQRILSDVRDNEVVYFWGKEFPLLKGNPQAPLLTRLDAFLRPKSLRYMAAQDGKRLDFRRLMDSRKIFLAKLSQGAIGDENSFLLGSLLTAKIGQAANSRQEQAKEARVPFFVYIDEFQNYITPSLAQLLSGVRKYGVGLTLAHQDLRQIKSRSEDVASAVLGNTYTRVVFRVGDHDAKTLSDGLSHFEAKDLQNLGIGQAIARVERSDFDFNLETVQAAAVDEEEAAERRVYVAEESRQQYCTPREEVEALLAEKYPAERIPESPPKTVQRDPIRSSKAAKPEAPPPEIAVAPPMAAPEVVERPETVVEKEKAVRVVPQLPGRGGPQHKYLQSLLKRSAEDRGFRVTLEKRVLDGAGHIDVAIEREGLSIGCEISVTTPVKHELNNVSKCLAAGFDYAVLVSSDKRVLASAEEAISSELHLEQQQRVRYLTPEGFIGFLEELEAKSRATSKTVRGYKVNVKYRALSDEDKDARKKLIADVISKSLRKNKKK